MRALSTSVIALIAAVATAPAFGQAMKPAGSEHETHGQAAGATSAPKPGMGGMMGGADMGRMMAMMHGGGMMADMPVRHVEGRLAFLRTELKIADVQAPQWNVFAEAVRGVAKNSQGMMQPMMGGMAPQPSAAEAMARTEAALVARLGTIRAVKAAFDPLYGVLSPEQRKVADEIVVGPMGVM